MSFNWGWAMAKRIVGSRYSFTKRVREDLPLAEGLRRAASQQTSKLDDLKRECWGVLADAGLPGKPGLILVGNAPGEVSHASELKWTPAEGMEDPSGWYAEVHPEALASGEFIPFDSPEGYACRILRLIQSTKAEIEKGNPSTAVNKAIYLGELVAEARFAEFYHERHISPDGYETHRKIVIDTAKELWANDKTARIGEVAKTCAKAAAVTSGTAREWIKKAGRNGEIEIPPQASRGGRPKRS